MRLWLQSLALGTLMVGAVACSKPETPALAEDSAEATNAPSREWTLKTSVDADGQLVTEVTPSPGYRINLEYPWRLTVDEEAQGASDAEDFNEKRVRFLAATNAEAGSTVDGELRFSVCNDATCLTPREKVSWQL